MAGKQHKRPSPTPSEESLSGKRTKALPSSPCTSMSGIVVKQEPGVGHVAIGRGGSLARAPAEEPGNPAVEWPRFNFSFEIRLFHCAVADCESHLKPPVFKCEAGHLLCSNCRREGHCGNCNRATTFVACPEVDRFIDGARLPCSYEASGCNKSVAYHEMSEHRDACAYAPCPCLVPGCAFAAAPPALRDHLAGEHGWAVHRLASYAKAYALRVPAAEAQRLVVVEGDAPRLFLLSLRWDGEGESLRVSVSCVRKTDAAGPDYKFCLFASAPPPPHARGQVELVSMIQGKVASCAVPGGPARRAVRWVEVTPDILLGPSREVQLSLRIEELR